MFSLKGGRKAERSANDINHLLVTWGIAGFVALACTALIGLEVFRVIELRSQILAGGRQDTTNLTSSLIQHAELTFGTADALLIGTVERLEHDKMDREGRARLKARFLQELRHSTEFVSFAVITSDGLMSINSYNDNDSEGIPVSDREYYAYHRDHNEDALHIGIPIRGRSTGRWLIPTSRRFNKADGSFGGIAVAAIDPQYFQGIYDRLELGENGNVLLATLDRHILVRRPYVEAVIGMTMSRSQLFGLLKKASKGTEEFPSSTDGVLRIVSYEQGQTYPIVVAVAQAKAALLAPWQRIAMHRLVETTTIAAIIMLIGAFAWHATRGLARHSKKLHETNTRFDAALANMPTGLAMFDADGKLSIWNAKYLKLYGMSPDIVHRGTSVTSIIEHRKALGHQDMEIEAYDGFRQELNDTGSNIKASQLNDGRTIAVANTAVADGGWVSIHEDITERVHDEATRFQQATELARINLRFDTALSHMTQGLCMFDEHKRLVVWNNRYVELYGVPRELLKVGTPYETIVADRVSRGVIKESSADMVKAQAAELSAFPAGSHRIDEFADGRIVLLSRQPMPGGGWLTVTEDITERKRAEAEIVHLARHDVLTGLANRAQFNEKLEEASKRLTRGDAAITVMMLDLDRFKAVNDTLGHPAGDELLVQVSRRLQSKIRETDVLARLGGDEFAIIQDVSQNQHEGAIALAMRIVQAISEPFDLNGVEASVGTSIGIAMAPEHGSEPEALLKHADLALYNAKASGRNDFRIYDPGMLAAATTQQSAESELRDAIAHGQFVLHYQPVVDIETREIRGVEALIRWRHPSRGLVAPDQFIPLAESTGLIGPIGEWILQRACADAAAWPARIKLAVNISAVQFKKGNLFDVILCALVESGMAPERLELEITETSLLDNQESHLTTIRQLKNLGISMALDDFGTGYSSVTYLTNFPFDKIKIDRTFTRDVLKRRDYAAVVSSVLALARGLGMVTTVEGVETEQQLEYMRQAGVDLAQGYLFSRPVPASELDFTIRYSPGGHGLVA